MAYLTQPQVTAIVTESLSEVADLPAGTANILNSPLTGMNDEQQHIFLSALKTNLNALPYEIGDGTTSDQAYYDIDLTPATFNQWQTVGDCVDWIVNNQDVVFK